jgi:hypothetical protein
MYNENIIINSGNNNSSNSINSSGSNNNDINKYNTHINDFIKRLPNNQYMFEFSKCCGYTELITEYKDKSLTDLYKTMQCTFGQLPIGEPIGLLYAVDQTNNTKMLVPNDPTVSVRQFIVANRPFFIPLYPIPMNIVYKMYYDDGVCHKQMDCCSTKKKKNDVSSINSINSMNMCDNANCPYFNDNVHNHDPCILHDAVTIKISG